MGTFGGKIGCAAATAIALAVAAPIVFVFGDFINPDAAYAHEVRTRWRLAAIVVAAGLVGFGLRWLVNRGTSTRSGVGSATAVGCGLATILTLAAIGIGYAYFWPGLLSLL